MVQFDVYGCSACTVIRKGTNGGELELRGVHGNWYTVPAAVRHGDIADTHTAPSHTDAKRRQQRSEPSRPYPNRTFNLHRPRQGPHAEVTYIMLITTFTNSDSASY